MYDKVRSINLDNNKCGSEGLSNLVKWVDNANKRCVLEELSLEGNGVGDVFIGGLVEALIRSNSPIRDLNLSKNNITDKGGCALAELIASHYHLRSIKINRNKIQSKGGIAIAEALKEN